MSSVEQLRITFQKRPTTVYAVSRRAVVVLENVHPISADLLDPADTRTKLEALKYVTDVIFGAYVE